MNINYEMNSRLAYIDFMRGIAILLVVAAHLIQANVVEGVNTKAFMFINSFHMPLFFAISGYLAEKVYKPLGEARSVLFFIRKKAVALLIPLFVWDLIVYKMFLTGVWVLPSFGDVKHEVFHPRLWFLLTLFLIFVGYSLFSFLSSRWNTNRKLYLDIILILSVFILYGFYYVLHLRAI